MTLEADGRGGEQEHGDTLHSDRCTVLRGLVALRYARTTLRNRWGWTSFNVWFLDGVDFAVALEHAL